MERVILSEAKNLLFPTIYQQVLRFAQHDMAAVWLRPETALRYNLTTGL